MALKHKKRHRQQYPYRRRTCNGKRVLRKRRRTRLLALVGLIVVFLLAFEYYGKDPLLDALLRLGSDTTGVERVVGSTAVQAPETIPQSTSPEESEATEEETTSQQKDKTSEDESKATPVPEDKTMYLSIPKLGVSGALVTDGDGGLELGAEHLPGTGYPWLPGSNTYIAGHRLGFPGTGSDHVFFGLPSLGPGDEIIRTQTARSTLTGSVRYCRLIRMTFRLQLRLGAMWSLCKPASRTMGTLLP